jgi:hypothetical protein
LKVLQCTPGFTGSIQQGVQKGKMGVSLCEMPRRSEVEGDNCLSDESEEFFSDDEDLNNAVDATLHIIEDMNE